MQQNLNAIHLQALYKSCYEAIYLIFIAIALYATIFAVLQNKYTER